jgi:uncharacterized membrane protein
MGAFMKRLFIILIALLIILSLSACASTSNDIDKYTNIKIIKITPVAYATSSIYSNNVIISYIQNNEYKQITLPSSRIMLVEGEDGTFVEQEGIIYLNISENKLIEFIN